MTTDRGFDRQPGQRRPLSATHADSAPRPAARWEQYGKPEKEARPPRSAPVAAARTGTRPLPPSRRAVRRSTARSIALSSLLM